MAKKPQSIDGFILAPRTDDSRARLDLGNIDNKSRPTLDPNMQNPSKNQRAKINSDSLANRKTTAKEVTREDIKDSLKDLEDSSSEKLTDLSQDRKTSRRQRKSAKKRDQLKKPRRARKIIKWTLIVVGVLLIGLAAFLIVKSFMTGGKVFQGNVLDMVTSKTRLNEDKNGRTNVLIFGTSGYSMDEAAWDGALLTDSIMVLSVDQDEKDAYMVSIPRDLYVKFGRTCTSGYEGKVNEVYSCGSNRDKDGKAGAKMFEDIIGDVLGIEMQYYVHANWTVLRDVVDSIGGVDVTIESSDPRGIYDYATNIKYPNGEAHLNGDAALALARARNSEGGYGLEGSNFDREIYQQKILVALQNKALKAGTLANPTVLSSLLDALGDNLRTDFKTSEFQTLIDLASGIKSENIISLPLVERENDEPDLVATGMINGASVVIPAAGTYDYSAIQAYISQNFSSDPATREAAVIDVLNGSEIAGLAQDKADSLEKLGFITGKITNAPENITETNIIYQLNPDKTATAKALEKEYNTTVKQGELTGYSTDADFVIVFGTAAAN